MQNMIRTTILDCPYVSEFGQAILWPPTAGEVPTRVPRDAILVLDLSKESNRDI
jgi:hypothetical protein